MTDYLTGPELSFSIFYLLPISFSALYNGRMIGLVVSFISAATWMYADKLSGSQYSHFLIPYWNAIVRFLYFSAHTVLLSFLLTMLDRMKALALRDPLTGASNWMFFEETSQRELAKMRRIQRPITISYIDLDDFKQVNDTLGHDAGDDLLRSVVVSITSNIRPADLLARTGGDEFALLLPDTDFQSASQVLKRLRENFKKVMTDRGYPVTLSIGTVTYNVIPSSVESMLKQADELMYKVKKTGRNNMEHIEWPAKAG